VATSPRRRGYLAPDGTVLRRLPHFASDTSALLSLYRGMVLTRAFDTKAVSLQRTGRLGTYAVSLGQEAVSIGIASACCIYVASPPPPLPSVSLAVGCRAKLSFKLISMPNSFA
jgi:hypothetical protein